MQAIENYSQQDDYTQFDDYIQLSESVERIVKTAVAEILLANSFEIHDKGRQDIVTSLDFAMERALKSALLANFPNDKFIGEEENHETLGPERTWVCDPIDGTVNFTQGIPYFGVQVALLIDRQPVFSLIHLPKLQETYLAIKGQGAFLNGEKLQANPSANLSRSIVTFGDFSKSNPTSRGFQLGAMRHLMEKAMRVRIQGASTVDFAFLAAGKNGCHIMFSQNLWEVAPGTMLATEAGCLTGQIDGQKHGFAGQGLVIALNQNILDEVISALEQVTEGK